MSASLSELATAPGADEPSRGRRLRILVVDDEEVTRYGFRFTLGSQPWVARCLTCSSAAEALRLTWRYEPHVALVGSIVGDVSGFELCRTLLGDAPRLRVIVMSWGRPLPADEARRSGASGTVSKSWSAAALARAVASVGSGGTAFAADTQDTVATLSAREREVLRLIARGATNREIANELHLSHHTVKEHTSMLYRKLRARNRAEAVRRAQRLGYQLDR